MTYATNSLGRSTGRRFNDAAIKREFLAKQNANANENYRGFEITGSKHVFVDNWPKGYTSRKAAREAVDVCLALRESLAVQG